MSKLQNNTLPFPIERTFPTPSMLISAEDRTLYNINYAAQTMLDKQDEIIALLKEIVAKPATKPNPVGRPPTKKE